MWARFTPPLPSLSEESLFYLRSLESLDCFVFARLWPEATKKTQVIWDIHYPAIISYPYMGMDQKHVIFRVFLSIPGVHRSVVSTLLLPWGAWADDQLSPGLGLSEIQEGSSATKLDTLLCLRASTHSRSKMWAIWRYLCGLLFNTSRF